ncbi:uroporphyrinogen-III C-methyltransferase [Stachybotrys elegans]|uniref:precorrin-2 dehydrogenase n=1 Tax=Stachybotrys elegans TaxID=80388 RepID=A0A8K0SPG4_9HYPO|nr:uroporphyrinogen-III C-methyltransferase [Stachybotrys elegans]
MAISSSSSSSPSLLAALNCAGNIHLVVGSNALASTRCTQSLNAGARPVLLAPASADLPSTLRQHIDDGAVQWHKTDFDDAHLFTLGREDVGRVVDAVFVTSGPKDEQSIHISELCRRNRIPVNVIDAPHLCTFTLLSTYSDGPLQVGVTTNGRGCKLASRIRRDIASSLPADLGAACDRLGALRRRIQQHDEGQHHHAASASALGELDDSVDQTAQFNRLVLEHDAEEAKTRRMRWLAQVCEYWPLKRLAAIRDDDIEAVLAAYARKPAPNTDDHDVPGGEDASGDSGSGSGIPRRKVGKLILAGSGPGHPDLLTQATHKAILTADVILADKLVPSGVLDLIPRRTPVQIARKFPGNADRAQEELLEMALAGVSAGQTVLRLKQGDPFIYGRGGEEVDFFRARGLGARVSVLPGITSALSAPLFAAIPPTQRDVADQVLICTGTGKKGKPPTPPEYVASRTVVFLMALHRIAALVEELTTEVERRPPTPGAEDPAAAADHDGRSSTVVSPLGHRALWPLSTPCAVIERASCPDQRVIRTTLADVVAAVEAEGSRPPGLLVVGNACDYLNKRDQGTRWVVQDGFDGLQVDDVLVGEAAAVLAKE